MSAVSGHTRAGRMCSVQDCACPLGAEAIIKHKLVLQLVAGSRAGKLWERWPWSWACRGGAMRGRLAVKAGNGEVTSSVKAENTAEDVSWRKGGWGH